MNFYNEFFRCIPYALHKSMFFARPGKKKYHNRLNTVQVPFDLIQIAV